MTLRIGHDALMVSSGRIGLVLVATCTVCACADSGSTGPGDAPASAVGTTVGTDMTAESMTSPPSSLPTSAATDTIVSMPSTSVPFVWDGSDGFFPADHWELTSCPEASPVHQPGDALSIVSWSQSWEYQDAAELRGNVGTVFVATVDQVRPAVTTTPINLPAEFFASTGVQSEAELAVSMTPTEMIVDDVVWGDADTTAVVGEFGCHAEGAIASLTPGAKLLVLAERVDPRFGPFVLFGGTHRFVDWYGVDDTNHLTPRIGFGLPPLAPFLVGMELSEAVTLLSAQP